jgi:hypothetical protein
MNNRKYTVMELFAKLVTKISVVTVLTATPIGVLKPVAGPEIVLAGATLPEAVRLYTVTE